jgi:hypothetical protein
MCRKIVGMLVVCLVLLVTAFGCGGNKHADKIDTNIGVSALVALADNHISSYANGLDTLAMTQEVQSGDWGMMFGLLKNVEEAQVTGTMWFVAPDGSYSTVALGKTDTNLSDRAYFPGLMAGNKVLGDVVFSKSTGNKSLIAASPVLRDGKVIGGLGASIFLDDLSKTLARELALPDDMVFYATTEAGDVVLHSDTQLILETGLNLEKDVEFETSLLTGWRFALGFKD